MDTDVPSIQASGWEDARSVSDGSLTTSNEQMTLVGFAYQLGSSITNNDGLADEVDVRKEAELLMSLSCSAPNIIEERSGRITPPSDSSSCYSSGSRRDSFCFTCPSLSLENHSREQEGAETKTSTKEDPPSVLLGRSLKVDDRDALRLSSEAMALNIMQSYRKAIEWRIQSWDNSLSRITANRERKLVEDSASEEQIRELLNSGEAMLLLKLRELAEKIKVLDAYTTFKVLPQRVTKDAETSEPSSKKQRTDLETQTAGLEETEYQYHVTHVMALECYLNVYTPAGHAQIEIQVPGTMAGTFLSSESYSEELTEVMIEINTEMLAAMIEKSSRMVVRASVEALLKGESEEEEDKQEEKKKTSIAKKEKDKADDEESAKTPPPLKPPSTATYTPQRRVSEDRVSCLFVVTPARDTTSSPLSYGDSDNDEKPVLLSIPDNFGESKSKSSLRMLTPQPSRARDRGDFTYKLPTVVTPHKTHIAEAKTKGKGPILPLLVEAACAAMRKN